jgi:putative sterol carrier protein
MPEPKVCEFSKHIADLCATRHTDVFRLAAKLRMDPMELLQMINGEVVPTKAVISGLAKELHSNVSLLTKLATENKP